MFKRLFVKKNKEEKKENTVEENVEVEAIESRDLLQEEGWEDQPFRSSELGDSEEVMEDSFNQLESDVEGGNLIEDVSQIPLEDDQIEEVEEIIEDVVEEVEEVIEVVEEEVVEAAPKKGFFGKLLEGLNKTRKGITDVMDDLFTNYGEIDDDLFEELEEILIMADVGMDTTMKIIDALRDELKARKIKEANLIKEVLGDVLMDFMANEESSHLNVDNPPSVVFVIGVNGAGKTTSIGKLAHRLKQENKTVLLAAADTFRAAAIDQLKVWGSRTDTEVIAQQEGSDAASVVFDAIQSAKSRKIDVLVVDTAGRLHNKKNLMNELAKIFKIVNREYPEAQKEVLLVLDATTGQNAVQQAKLFKEAADITGLVLTKLDGTAKGGAVLAIKNEVGIPVKLVGVGEGINDLEHFEPESFVKALLELK